MRREGREESIVRNDCDGRIPPIGESFLPRVLTDIPSCRHCACNVVLMFWIKSSHVTFTFSGCFAQHNLGRQRLGGMIFVGACRAKDVEGTAVARVAGISAGWHFLLRVEVLSQVSSPSCDIPSVILQ